MVIDYDTVCYCGHIYDEHSDTSECAVKDCDCLSFDADWNNPENENVDN